MDSKLMENLLLIWKQNSENPETVKILLWLIATIVDSDWTELQANLAYKDEL